MTDNTKSVDRQPQQFLVGNFGQNPEIKYFESGNTVMNGSLAVHEGKDTPPTWVAVKAWNGVAKLISDLFTKGDKIVVKGYFETESWIDKTTGEDRERQVFVAKWVEGKCLSPKAYANV